MSLQVVSQPAPVDQQQALTQAFDQFNQLSQQLSYTYATLEARVSDLTSELTEVSEQREDAIREKEGLAERLNELIDFLPGGVVVLSREGKVEQFNPAAIHLLGKLQLGESWLNVINRCFLPRVDDGHEVSTIDGRRLGIATGAMQAQGQIVLITDLTHTRELQSRLNRQERLASMGKMVSALAHQIRTPLSSAMLYSSHLLEDELPPEKRRKFCQKLSQRLQHMEQQVRDMLLFVKGDLALNDSVSVGELQTDLCAAIEPLHESNSITCVWTNTCAQHQLRCNRDVLVGAIMNLVNNAIQAQQFALSLEITFTEVEKNCLSISVQDNGPGIATKVLNDCQEAFVTTKSQGIGLGLNVVKIVARAHGGHFDIVSPSHGGTLATLSIPFQALESGNRARSNTA